MSFVPARPAVAAVSLLLGAIFLPVARAESPASAPPNASSGPVAPAPGSARASAPVRAAPGELAKTAELPALQPGLWEFRRTVTSRGRGEPKVETARKCSDPIAEFRQKMTELEAKGCQFSPTRRTHDQYVSQWVCQTPAGIVRFQDVLISTSSTAYQTVSEAHNGEQVTRTTTDAMRVSDCTAQPPPGSPQARRKLPEFLKQGAQH
jgi:hypothetical protein